ncbi:MAG: T9SS type A sorting domain-containing protein [Flavobacteriales bacterium]|nr:T9SS type A sorting domain-containing protein [Flavobacteriales bacterium]
MANLENGDLCDDGNPNTVNDVVTNCIRAGTLLDDDCEGVPGGPAQPGTACDDLSACTTNDLYDANCNCVGTVIDLTIDTLFGPTDVDTGMTVIYWVTPISGATGYVWSLTPSAPYLDWSTSDSDTTDATAILQIGADTIAASVCVYAVNDSCAGNEICLSFSTGLSAVGSSSDWFTIFPNPSNGTFQVSPAGPITSAIDIRIFDALGQLAAAPVVLTGSQPQRLDLHEKANGMYFLRATRGSESQMLELVIQR